jgi:hypothetical protein
MKHETGCKIGFAAAGTGLLTAQDVRSPFPPITIEGDLKDDCNQLN